MRVIVSEKAEKGLDTIYDYVIKEFGLGAYLDLEDEINKVLKGLANHPRMYASILLKDGTKPRRAVVSGISVLLYEVDDSTETAVIVNAFDARTDWK